MLWHVVVLEVPHLDEADRQGLETKIERLSEIPEVLWFHLGRDLERPATTAFISVFRDHDALERYRLSPVHVEVARAIRESAATPHRLDLDGLPLPR